ncbi:Hsp20/alpha crystallin family protein [Virgibacillus sp. W0430]|uniref:Hsp20/alpha crystallin family protein n=1 Tax=Virgibacillus sp. W0430 TaxID=3391580 RepID=UPI003F484357
MKPLRQLKNNYDSIHHVKNEVNNAFQRFFEEPLTFTSPWNKEHDFFPPINVIENLDRYTIEVEIPGMCSEDVNVTIENNMLTIKGEKKLDDHVSIEENTMHIKERAQGVFHRSLTLPNNANADRISAECKKGVLNIYIPKDRVNSKQIEIE